MIMTGYHIEVQLNSDFAQPCVSHATPSNFSRIPYNWLGQYQASGAGKQIERTKHRKRQLRMLYKAISHSAHGMAEMRDEHPSTK